MDRRKSRFWRTAAALFLVPMLAACGEVGAPEWLQADGRWAWGESAEAACASTLQVRIRGEHIDWFEGDQRIRQGRRLERTSDGRGAVSTGVGKLDKVRWRYAAQRLDDPSKLAFYQDEFSVRRSLGSITHLVLERRLRRLGPDQPLAQLDTDYPGKHQRWYYCDGAAPGPGQS